MEFLASGVLKPPKSLHRPVKAAGTGRGKLLPTFKRGVVLLRNGRGVVFRVGWEPITKPAKGTSSRTSKHVSPKIPRPEPGGLTARSLDAGVYTLTGYRLIRRDKRGVTWFISTTAPRGIRDLKVVAGKEETMEIDPSIVVDCSARRTKMGLRVTVTISGEIEAGLSIYRKGSRIPIVYRVLGKQGQVVATGKMEYG